MFQKYFVEMKTQVNMNKNSSSENILPHCEPFGWHLNLPTFELLFRENFDFKAHFQKSRGFPMQIDPN